tara:strand:+ start:43808 stop:44161 length:354 start_codon:yes stop_codon:yes gene_type:complete
MKLAVVGSREFTDYNLLKQKIEFYCQKELPSLFISGGCKSGADYYIYKLATEELEIPILTIPAKWKTLGRPAGPIRNRLIIEACSACVAFWNGSSRGTKSSIDICAELNKPCKIVRF